MLVASYLNVLAFIVILVCLDHQTFVFSAAQHMAGFDYFALKSATGGCIGRKSDGGDALILKACMHDDDTIYWRLDDMGKFHSKVNDNECIQVGQRPEIEDGVDDGLQRGTRVYVKSCVQDGLKYHFQWFDELWKMEMSGPLSLQMRPDLCVVHFSADNPVLGESRIMMLECAALGGSRALGWEALYMDYFTLDSPSGGCIARKTDGGDGKQQ